MVLIQIPTEQTTAATDFILAIVASYFTYSYHKIGYANDKKRAVIWSSILALFAISSFLGVIAHGFEITEQTKFIIWQPLNLALGLMIGLIVVGVFYDLKGPPTLGYTLPIMLALSLLFYALTLLVSGAFILFIIYEGIAMLIALAAYSVMGYTNTLSGAWYIALGILITIIAAFLQTLTGLNIKIIWEFNHNGIFHIVQLLGLIFIYLGLLAQNNKLNRLRI